MKCIIVEDEPMALKLLQTYVEKMPSLQLVASFRNAIMAVEYIHKNPVELIFLDINMPDLNGIQLLKALKTRPKVIFTTAYSEYAVQSYEFDAVDYLLKPFEFERFMKAVGKATVEEEIPKNTSVSAVKDVFTKDSSDEFTFIKSGTQVHRIELSQILYMEANGNYINVTTINKKVLTLMKMKDLLSQLPEDRFVQVHRSFIVSLSQIDMLEKHRVVIKGKEIPIGNLYRENFFKLMK